jgi:hypothetical protein
MNSKEGMGKYANKMHQAGARRMGTKSDNFTAAISHAPGLILRNWGPPRLSRNRPLPVSNAETSPLVRSGTRARAMRLELRAAIRRQSGGADRGIAMEWRRPVDVGQIIASISGVRP